MHVAFVHHEWTAWMWDTWPRESLQQSMHVTRQC